jgi:hypothetical protein
MTEAPLAPEERLYRAYSRTINTTPAIKTTPLYAPAASDLASEAFVAIMRGETPETNQLDFDLRTRRNVEFETMFNNVLVRIR